MNDAIYNHLKVHMRINERQARILRHYRMTAAFMFNTTFKESQERLRIPKWMTYGGYRNTCYHTKGL